MSSWGLDVLAVGPHPDDVELCCGGTIAGLVSAGHRVEIVDLTEGELASNGTVDDRRVEAAQAGEILGVRERHNLGLPDGGLSVHDDAQVAALVELLRRLKPELILAPPERARHPDHEAASAVVRRAVFLANLKQFGNGLRTAPRRLLHYEMRVAITPAFVVDTSGSWDAKRRAIASYGSQMVATSSTASTLVNDSGTMRAIEARDRRYGAMIGAEFGEPFSMAAQVGVTDPLELLRRGPAGPIHLFEDQT
ncbi:MAG: bacillithiol biosynthesis deacetylase BshB1 [Myxococcota bacterium]|jgi:bacillithiol biosynthesis deacetylase BshB1